MSVSAESSQRLAASIDGAPVTVSFSPSVDPILSWSDANEGGCHEVFKNQVIGIIPTVTAQPTNTQTFQLYYVQSPAIDAQDESADQSRLKILTLEPDVPQQLLQDHGQHGTFFNQLLTDDSRACHVIVSTGSGHRHARKAYENLIQPLFSSLNIHSFTLHETASADTITDLTIQSFRPAALAGSKQLIILLSGDGGIVDLLNGLLHTFHPTALPSTYAKPLVALLPFGTGNALAHSSGITADRTLGLSTLFHGNPAPLPSFSVHFNPAATPVTHSQSTPPAQVQSTTGAVVFSWALHAALVADSDTATYRALGAARFPAAAKENLFPPSGGPPHPYKGTVSIQHAGSAAWNSVPGDTHSYVLATLCARLERGFTVSPASAPLDGRLRFVHISAGTSAAPMTGERIMECMKGGYAGGTHVDEEDVLYADVAGLRVIMQEGDADADAAGGMGRWRRVCVDGKIFEVPRGGEVLVRAPEGGAVLDLVHVG